MPCGYPLLGGQHSSFPQVQPVNYEDDDDACIDPWQDSTWTPYPRTQTTHSRRRLIHQTKPAAYMASGEVMASNAIPESPLGDRRRGLCRRSRALTEQSFLGQKESAQQHSRPCLSGSPENRKGGRSLLSFLDRPLIIGGVILGDHCMSGKGVNLYGREGWHGVLSHIF